MTPRIAAQEAFKLALSMVLAYGLALSMGWDFPKYAGLAIIVVSLGSTGASLRKGLMRLAGTTLGLFVGLLMLACFAQTPALFFGSNFLYLLAIGYLMQTSRYSYAWYVAGFLPILVWAPTYMEPNPGSNGFHYAAFRYLETTSGILIYTLVCIFVWPRNAGTQVEVLGKKFWKDLRALVPEVVHPSHGDASETIATLRTGLAANLIQVQQHLDAAFADTPTVMREQRTWKALRNEMSLLLGAVNLLGETVEDLESLDLAMLLPGLKSSMTRLDRRFAEIEILWQTSASAPASGNVRDDETHLEPLNLLVDEKAFTAASHADRAALLCFVQQLEILDEASRETNLALRALAGLARHWKPHVGEIAGGLFRTPLWDPQRLLKALYPALCFVVAFVFWIYLNPPGGPSIPSTTVAISLSMLMTPMSPVAMLVAFFGALWFVVAPVYCLLMPQLSTGPELLSLIFAYTFLFGYLARWNPVLKLIPIVLFEQTTGISNSQTYSFMTMVGGSMMLLLPLSVMALVDLFWTPTHPGKLFLNSMQRFFRGCSRVVGSFVQTETGKPDSGAATRRRYYHGMLQPAPSQMQAAAARLARMKLGSSSPRDIRSLIQNLQSIRFRLQALDLSHQRVMSDTADSTEPVLGPVALHLQQQIEHVFDRWAQLELTGTLDEERRKIKEVARELQHRLEAMEPMLITEDSSNQIPRDHYALVSSIRGLLKAMKRTQEAMKQIDFREWSVPRF